MKPLSIVYQNKTRMPGKKKKCWLIYEKLQFLATIDKVFGYRFRWICVELSDEMDLNVQMRKSNNLKHRDAISLKFGDKFFTSPTMLGHERQYQHGNQRKSTFIFSLLAFVIAAII